MWRDPKLQLVNRTIRDMFQRAGGEQLAAALLPIALPRLRTAAFEMMLPSWQAMHDLVVALKLDTVPLERAASDTMVDPAVQRLAMPPMLEIPESDSAWRVGAFLAAACTHARPVHTLPHYSAAP